jgi:diguanylate cyclase (GGDEF)-like protein
MSLLADSWAAQQLTEYLTHLGTCDDVGAALRTGVERSAEAFEAEAGAVVRHGVVAATVGFPAHEPPPASWGRPDERAADVPGLGMVEAVSAPLEGDGWIALAREGERFGVEESALLRGMARALEQTVRMLELVGSLRRRQDLLERLAEIQRSIVHRTDLEALLNGIVEGAQALIGDEVVALRLLDDHDPEMTRLAASTGLDAETRARVRRGRVGTGAGGAAIATGELIVLEDYADDDRANPQLAAGGLRAAMSAPVWRNGVVCGCLTVGSRRRGRRYGDDEREVLASFAKHASLALTDAHNHTDAVHRALHDPLTELPNRSLFLDRLRQAEERAARSGSCVAVLFLDLDGFKTVNDSLGHRSGDELLIGVAARLADVLRAGDTAARLGGDEFAMLVEDLPAEREAIIVAERVMAALRDPFTVAGQAVAARASVGVTTARGPGSDLLRDADLAMYQAKADGRDRIVVYNGDMHAAMVERMALERDLRAALDGDELHLEFQPIVDLGDGHVVATEALLRWRHPRRGNVPPLEFVPLAEETGLIVPLGSWVLEAACRAATEWDDVPVSVNVSSVQLRSSHFPATVEAALAAASLAPERLILEITETMLVQDVERTAAQLAELKRLGVRIAIDDFGTGHSSLQYLQRLPIDTLKIPKPFVDELASELGEGVLARAILDLARSFGLQVIAEGIEVEAQRDRLAGLGCAAGQGFLFARPLAPEALVLLLAQTSGIRPSPVNCP